MRVQNGALVAALLGLTLVVGHVSAQAPAPTPAGQAPAPTGGRAGGRGARGAPPDAAGARGGQRRGATFPAQQREPDDPAVVARGKGLYEVNCQVCHGVDLRGGDQGGPNLLRSAELLDDKNGERIEPIVKGGRPPKMPPSSLSDADIHATAIYLHSVAATMQGQGGPPRGSSTPPPAEAVVVGNVAAGQAYFAAKCSACHSTTGDLQGIGGRFPDPRTLQSTWVSGGGGGGRGGRGARGGGGGGSATTVTVTLASGQKVEGELTRIDEFLVILKLPDGTERSFVRNGDVPKVDVHDPRQPHRDLIAALTDKDMHDVTAYLWSLR
jgi:cytochrome c oxidase cbb3-type subunit III